MFRPSIRLDDFPIWGIPSSPSKWKHCQPPGSSCPRDRQQAFLAPGRGGETSKGWHGWLVPIDPLRNTRSRCLTRMLENMGISWPGREVVSATLPSGPSGRDNAGFFSRPNALHTKPGQEHRPTGRTKLPKQSNSVLPIERIRPKRAKFKYSYGYPPFYVGPSTAVYLPRDLVRSGTSASAEYADQSSNNTTRLNPAPYIH